MAHTSLITDEMRAAIGVESLPVTWEVEKGACRMFARAVGFSDLMFYDEEYARGQGYRSIVAPPGYLGSPVYLPNRPSPASGIRRFNIPLKRILNGGTDLEYSDTVCAGDVLTAREKIVEINQRDGRLGPMLVSITETTYRNRDGRVVATLRGTLISY